jgi:hypothetical protein
VSSKAKVKRQKAKGKAYSRREFTVIDPAKSFAWLLD